MRTLLKNIPLALLLCATACGTAHNESANTKTTDEAASADKATALGPNEEAISRRAVRVARLSDCMYAGDSLTWKHLSMTTDQVRWVEELQGRVRNRNDNATASLDKAGTTHASTTYVFNDRDRRELAEILTDEQLEKWMELCPNRQGDMH